MNLAVEYSVDWVVSEKLASYADCSSLLYIKRARDESITHPTMTQGVMFCNAGHWCL